MSTPDKQKNKYRTHKIVALGVTAILFGIIIFSGLFVYQYAYETLTNANAVISLNSDAGVNLIDNRAFELSKKNISIKQEMKDVTNNKRNIFTFSITPTNTTTNEKLKPKK